MIQILKIIQGQNQDQNRFGQDKDLKKMVLRPRQVLRTTSLFHIKWELAACL